MRKYFLEDFYNTDKCISYKRSVGNTVRFIYDDIIGNFKIINYKYENRQEYILINYKEELSYLSTQNIKNNYFPFLKAKEKKRKKYLKNLEFKYEINENIIDEKRNITIINRYFENKNKKNCIVREKYYDFLCKKCGYTKKHVAEQSLYNQKTGCPCCSGRITVYGVNDITTTDPWMIKYFANGYNEAKLYQAHSKKKIKMICPDCGKIKIMEISNLKNRHVMACSCKDGFSFPEKFITSLLDQTQIEYEYQKKFNWCEFYNPYKNKKCKGIYDFYIESLKLIIEADGGWHKKDNNLSKQSKEESEFIDNQKDKLAFENDITLVRIDCSKSSMEYISNSIKQSILGKYFDLSHIDYKKCNSYALSNIRKKVINEFINNPYVSTKYLSDKYNITMATVWQWLNNENIDIKSKSNNLKRKPNIYASKKVKVIDSGKEYIYPSIICLSNNFEKDYGIKANYNSIIRCLKNNRKYKGKKIEYIIT